MAVRASRRARQHPERDCMRQYYNPAAIEYAGQKGIFLIPGVEQNIEGVHVLLLNFPKGVADSVSTFKELAEARIKLQSEGAPEKRSKS